MICINHKECNSTECGHRTPHTKNDFCFDGKCKWAENTVCIPESKRERLIDILVTYGNPNKADEAADKIEETYKEEGL